LFLLRVWHFGLAGREILDPIVTAKILPKWKLRIKVLPDLGFYQRNEFSLKPEKRDACLPVLC